MISPRQATAIRIQSGGHENYQRAKSGCFRVFFRHVGGDGRMRLYEIKCKHLYANDWEEYAGHRKEVGRKT
jgi:hypothetical protein